MTTFVGGTAGAITNGANVTLDLTALTGGSDSSPSEGDLVIVVSSLSDCGTDEDMSMSTAGYTEVADLYEADSRDANVGVFYKFMGPSPDTSAVVAGNFGSNNSVTAACMVFRGVKPVASGGPFAATPTTDTGTNSSAPNPPSISFSGAGVWTVIAAGSVTITEATYTLPTGYTTDAQQISQNEAFGAGGAIIGYNSSPTSPEDPGVITSTEDAIADSWAAVTMALAPNAQTEQYGIASETDAALAFATSRAALYGVASETEAALAFAHAKLAAYGIAEETDLALAVTEIITFGTAEEVDAALAFVASKSKLGEYLEALETDTALPFVVHKHPGGGVSFQMGSAHSPFMLKQPSPRRRRNR